MEIEKFVITITHLKTQLIYIKILKHTKKKKIIENLVDKPKSNIRGFWAREMKFLNEILTLFDSEDFWTNLKFNKKFDSLLYFKTDFGESILNKKINEFRYKPKKTENITLGPKCGDDYKTSSKPKTIKQFLKYE